MRVIVPNWIRVGIQWRTISDSFQDDWPFRAGGVLKPDIVSQAKGSRIYRFLFPPDEGPASCYIGESERLELRIRQYMRALQIMRSEKPARKSSVADLTRAVKRLHSDSKVRVGAAILNGEFAKKRVELQLIDFDEFVFNKVEISMGSLTSPFHRKAMENLAILDADLSGLRVLNRGRDVTGKDLTRLLAKRAKVNNATQK